MKKLWSKKEFLLYLSLLLFVNIMLLWINVQPAPYRPAASAYRRLSGDIASMTQEEKTEYITQRADMMRAVTIIDNVMQISKTHPAEGRRMRAADYREEFDRWYPEYAKGDYLRYTDNIFSEYSFLDQMSMEIREVDGYEDFLRGV